MKALLILTALLLASCAGTAPPLTARSPASPDAPEGARIARHASLRTDDATRQTAALISNSTTEATK
jgi:hypothetical protein